MEKIKDIKQNSSIFHKKTIFSKIKRLNSPIFDKNKIYNILLLNDNSNKNIKSQIIKIAKSSKLIGHNQTSIQQKTKLKYEINKYNEKNSIYQKKIKSITPYCSNESSKILSNTQKNIPFMPFSSRYSKGNSNDNIFGNKSNGNKINKNLTYKINLSKNSTDKKRKINLKINNIIKNMNNYKNNIHNNDIQKIIFDINKTSNKKNNFYSSKFSISLDNILSKKIKSKEKKNIILSKKIGQANKWAICSPRDNPINVNNRHLYGLLTSNEILPNEYLNDGISIRLKFINSTEVYDYTISKDTFVFACPFINLSFLEIPFGLFKNIDYLKINEKIDEDQSIISCHIYVK
jgi:hypothetical protein